MTKRQTRRPIEVVRSRMPALVGPETPAGRGMALVGEVLAPWSTDAAAAALFQLLDLVEGIDDRAGRTEVAFYCMVQCGLYLDDHVEVLKAISAVLRRGRESRAAGAERPAARKGKVSR